MEKIVLLGKDILKSYNNENSVDSKRIVKIVQNSKNK